jgi:anti-sigma regulatory factor (Ser/Thr protein kinase)
MLKNVYPLGQNNSVLPDESHSHQRDHPSIIQQKNYQLQTFEEARNVAYQLSQHYPFASRAETGLNELLINAIEHGNLNINFEEKQRILQDNDWMNTVYERLFLLKNKQKKVYIQFEKIPACITVQIKDQGDGFEWHKFLDNKPGSSANGRGIFIAKNYAFDTLEYLGNGNHVICRSYLSGHPLTL